MLSGRIGRAFSCNGPSVRLTMEAMNVATEIVRETWLTLCAMAPYLLFGFLVAGILSVLISPEWVERHLGGRGLWPIIKASLFGVPLPLCSCSVIPVATSLRRHGSSKGATTAFLLSTPQTGVDSVLATYSLLGPVFAIFRPLAAFACGLLGGGLVQAFSPAGAGEDTTPACADACCSHGHHLPVWQRILRHGFVVLPRDLARPLLVGLVVAGIISGVVPDTFFADHIGTGIGAMFLMMLVGIPLYVCATASIPIAAAMMLKGISPGAALVFLMTGPATNAAAIATLWAMLGRRTALIYLSVVMLTALLSGLALDSLFSVAGFASPLGHAEVIPHSVRIVAAILLLAILARSMVWPDQHAEKRENEES